ncbi:MAG: hypothetical protein LLG40_04900 [Deltaproteobacteria bacterium]|nr:hypothetical protein [Deltaproteobacteria bacterium]
MAGKIFYRERLKVGEKEKKPRFKLVAVADVNIKFYAEHLKKRELEDIAASVGADLILITAPKDGTVKEEEIEVKE